MRSATFRSVAPLLLVSLGCLLMSGCKGCRPWNPFARKDKDKQKKKREIERPFSFEPIRPLPSDSATQGLRPVKPGHVTELVWSVRANREDVRATAELSLLDGRTSEAVVVPETRFLLTANRDVALPKGQDKQLRFSFPLPPPTESKQFAFQTRLYPRKKRRSLNLTRDLATTMPASQFFLVVVARQPDRYAFLKQLYSVRQPPFELGVQNPAVYYQVLQPPADEAVLLPQSSLAWSPIAYLVWDEIPWGRLTGEQQSALLTWLHWGGQLIISGPNSLELLMASDLAPYLPATGSGIRKLQQSDFAELNRAWSIPSRSKRGRPKIEFPATSPLAGVELVLTERGRFVAGCGELLAESSVGRGRIVVTAFPLDARPVINWRSFDGFFNACLLRHAPRRFQLLENIQPMWAYMAGQGNRRLINPDGTAMTGVRFFARDTGDAARITDLPTAADRLGIRPSPPRQAGIASWNDGGAVARAAEEALQQASGITVPDRSFVWKSLALYLFVLVPLNWGVFRLVGRVEWAWIAAPFIAVIGAVWVVHQAQLNIGFARSRDEVAVLELHAGFPRGHLSRYTALYSSLSTTFDLEFESPQAVAQPFGGGKTTGRVQRVGQVSLWADETVRLTGFQVESNSTAMIHSEEFRDVGGALAIREQAGAPILTNRTGLALRGVAVLRRDDDGEIRGAWVGRLDPGADKHLQFRIRSASAPWFEQWDQLDASRERTDVVSESPSVRNLLRVGVRNLPLDKGQMRLVGWVESIPPGLKAQPSISQASGITFVIASLVPAPIAEPRRDANLYMDVVRKAEGNDSEDDP